MSGPLPNPNRRERRRPKPWEVSAYKLPAGGRPGPAPEPPQPLEGVALEWWTWAWATPQAAAWDVGTVYTVLRRAKIEAELAELDARVAETAADARHMATARVSLARAAGASDTELGLSPKGRAMLHWTIEAEAAPPRASTPDPAAQDAGPAGMLAQIEAEEAKARVPGAPVTGLRPAADDIFEGLFDDPHNPEDGNDG